ncbi:fibronectin domain containing protein [Nitzschia inconspicua]|uniref:Fibronectin domain containing protein n=1 Tax=Nitzschia inconspicua TaxID=303405 RepID=A0A9K3L9G8_9STRA|nr:fibronectin domain containing protein [Nitzschia inconspicua]
MNSDLLPSSPPSPHCTKKQRKGTPTAQEKGTNEETNSFQQMYDDVSVHNVMDQEQDIQEQFMFMEHSCGAIMLHALSFLDVVTLLRKQVVSKHFKDLCTKAITSKCGKDGPKPLSSEQLRKAVGKFCEIMYKEGSSNKEEMEEIACNYGFPIDSWNVSKVIDMSQLFSGQTYFNEYIGSWDTSNVRTMQGMFENATYFNQDIGKWDVSNVFTMSGMFSGAEQFNQYIGGWDVSMVVYMAGMFEGATRFNQDIGNWDVSNAEFMDDMFKGAKEFNQDIGRWDVTNVRYMEGMFYGAEKFNQYIGGWNVSYVRDMSGMFRNALTFNQDIGRWDVSSLREMSEMFEGAEEFNQDIGNWNIFNYGMYGSNG